MRDLRRYARQTNVRLIAGAVLLVFVIGDGLIYVIYGLAPALMGFACLLAGLSPILLILLALALMDWIVKRANRD
ncbi:MAG: hypothetical protein AB1846_05975 [Chloroflexota bacterium]